MHLEFKSFGKKVMPIENNGKRRYAIHPTSFRIRGVNLPVQCET